MYWWRDNWETVAAWLLCAAVFALMVWAYVTLEGPSGRF